MIAQLNPIRREERLGSVIRLPNGTRLGPEDIRTAAQGRAILDEIDAVISEIKEQLVSGPLRTADINWRARAENALRNKKRVRGVVTHRIGELAKAERYESRRAAFIDAAEAMLDQDLFAGIWRRAAETSPGLFRDRGDATYHAEAPDASA